MVVQHTALPFGPLQYGDFCQSGRHRVPRFRVSRPLNTGAYLIAPCLGHRDTSVLFCFSAHYGEPGGKHAAKLDSSGCLIDLHSHGYDEGLDTQVSRAERQLQ